MSWSVDTGVHATTVSSFRTPLRQEWIHFDTVWQAPSTRLRPIAKHTSIQKVSHITGTADHFDDRVYLEKRGNGEHVVRIWSFVGDSVPIESRDCCRFGGGNLEVGLSKTGLACVPCFGDRTSCDP